MRLASRAALGGALILGACVSTPAPILGPPPFGEPRPEVSAPPPAPQIVDQDKPLQCVPFARDVSGIQIYGDAHTWWVQADGRYPRANAPKADSVIVMGPAGASTGHVAVVRRILSEREILVDHANWLNRGEVTLNVPVRDVSEAGDWSQVRVWHIPSGGWGGRIYPVHGFVLAR